MVKTIISVCVALALALTAVGCACAGTGTLTSPSPAVSVKPVTTPMATTGTTPGTAASPGTQASPGTSASPGASAGGTIENFKEGTEVKASDVPEVQQAITAKYPDATINSIKHAFIDNAQVYAGGDQKRHETHPTVYVARRHHTRKDRRLAEQNRTRPTGWLLLLGSFLERKSKELIC